MTLTASGVQPLDNGFHYEAWGIIAGKPVDAGSFNVDAGGNLVSVGGAPIVGGKLTPAVSLATASKIVITIEPANASGAPSATHYLGGPLQNGSALLTVGDSAALGSSFAEASGTFILAAPTGGPSVTQKSGLWFINIVNMMPQAGLTLPTLPAGWKYEGWAVVNGAPITTGKFSKAAGADESAPFSGSMPGPPFPGEDFLQNAPAGFTFPLDLSGGKAVVSVEPDPDDSPAPFTLKPLVGDVPPTATDHTPYPLGNKAAAAPTMSATVDPR